MFHLKHIGSVFLAALFIFNLQSCSKGGDDKIFKDLNERNKAMSKDLLNLKAQLDAAKKSQTLSDNTISTLNKKILELKKENEETVRQAIAATVTFEEGLFFNKEWDYEEKSKNEKEALIKAHSKQVQDLQDALQKKATEIATYQKEIAELHASIASYNDLKNEFVALVAKCDDMVEKQELEEGIYYLKKEFVTTQFKTTPPTQFFVFNNFTFRDADITSWRLFRTGESLEMKGNLVEDMPMNEVVIPEAFIVRNNNQGVKKYYDGRFNFTYNITKDLNNVPESSLSTDETQKKVRITDLAKFNPSLPAKQETPAKYKWATNGADTIFCLKGMDKVPYTFTNHYGKYELNDPQTLYSDLPESWVPMMKKNGSKYDTSYFDVMDTFDMNQIVENTKETHDKDLLNKELSIFKNLYTMNKKLIDQLVVLGDNETYSAALKKFVIAPLANENKNKMMDVVFIVDNSGSNSPYHSFFTETRFKLNEAFPSTNSTMLMLQASQYDTGKNVILAPDEKWYFHPNIALKEDGEKLKPSAMSADDSLTDLRDAALKIAYEKTPWRAGAVRVFISISGKNYDSQSVTDINSVQSFSNIVKGNLKEKTYFFRFVVPSQNPQS